MIIDSNVFLGNWPYRRLSNNKIENIVRLMNGNKIDKGIISSLNSVFYRNCQAGNEELYEAIKPFKNRFIPFATINPSYTGWKDDLKLCIEKYKFLGVRIHPNHHNYKPNDKCLQELVVEIKKYRVPLAVTVCFEDNRQKHWLDIAKDLAIEDICKIVKSSKGVPVLINNAQNILEMADMIKKTLPKANFYVDTAFSWGPPQDDIQRFIEKFGAEHLVVGTNIPFRYPNVAITRVNLLEASARDKKHIFSGNLIKLLK